MTLDAHVALLRVRASRDPQALIRVLNEVHRRGATIESLEATTVDDGMSVAARLCVPAGRTASLREQILRLPCVIEVDLDHDSHEHEHRPQTCGRTHITHAHGRATEPTNPIGGKQ